MVAFGPDASAKMQRFFSRHGIPFRGVSDPKGAISASFGQQWHLLRGGRMPALLALTDRGEVTYRHFGTSMRDLGDIEKAAASLGR